MSVADGDWFTLARQSGAPGIDVRPLLAEGQEPFDAILDLADRVEPGGFLLVDAPFDPRPIRGVLAGRGFRSVARELGPCHWRVCFRRTG